MPLRPLGKPSVIFEGTRIKVINNEGVLPPQMTPVGGRLSNFLQGWKRIMNDPYVLSIVAKGYKTSFYESTPSPSNSLGDQISPGPRRNFGHAGTNHPHAPKERDNRGASEFTRVLFERIPGTKSFRRVASSYRSKESERPHSCTSFPYVHDKLCSKLRSKRRLHVQNRPAGCVLSRTCPS